MAKKSKTMENVINSTPTLLYYNGEYIAHSIEKELITKEEILAEVRRFRLERIEDMRGGDGIEL